MQGTRWAILGAGAGAALLAFALLPLPQGTALALALAAAGALGALVLGVEGVPPADAAALASGSARAATDLARALALTQRPVFVPAIGNLSRARVFLPTSDETKPLPPLDDETLLYAGAPQALFGVAVEPAGLALLDEATRATGATLERMPLADLETFLRGAGLRSDLWRDLALTREGAYEVRFRSAPGAPCGRNPDACAAGLCPVCSALGTALARAVGMPLRLVESRPGETKTLRFQEVPS